VWENADDDLREPTAKRWQRVANDTEKWASAANEVEVSCIRPYTAVQPRTSSCTVTVGFHFLPNGYRDVSSRNDEPGVCA
jgi:hypothetical protein